MSNNSSTTADVPPRNEETYLGDGLYASFDGWCVRLRAPREDGSHYVMLDPETYLSLRNWLFRHAGLHRHMGGYAVVQGAPSLTTDMRAAADFLDWLGDRDYVVAQMVECEWAPISEETALELARSFLEEKTASDEES